MINESEVKRAAGGDTEAFQNLIEEMKVYMYAVAIRYLKNEDDAGDAIGSAVLSAYENLKSLKRPQYFKTWITRILINECNKITKAKKRVVLVEDYKDIEGSYTEEIEEGIDIRGYIDKLPDIHKAVVLMYFYQEMSIEEIAASLKISKGTVKSRLFNAKKALKRIIERKGGVLE